MHKVCKIRVYPNKTQINIINGTLGCCRCVSNMYLAYEQEMYKNTHQFISSYDFIHIITKLKNNTDDYSWMKDYSAVAIQHAIIDEEKGLKKFFKKKGGFPSFKSRKRMKKESYYFGKEQIKFDTRCKNIIKIPILGKVRITERNYLPDRDSITSGRVIKDGNKYYLMFIYDTYYQPYHITYDVGYGIDVCIKTYATISTTNGDTISCKHFKDDTRWKMLEEKKKRLQQILSNKVEVNYARKINAYMDSHEGEQPNDKYKNIMKGESYNTSGVRRVRRKINKLDEKMYNIRKDYICKLVHMIVVKAKPRYITIEDLSVSNLLSVGNTDLHRYISLSGFYYFRTKLSELCKWHQVELRIANKFFASSKKCSNCGYKIKDLKLSDRIFKCPECGMIKDRDINASINLLYTKKYSIDFA